MLRAYGELEFPIPTPAPRFLGDLGMNPNQSGGGYTRVGYRNTLGPIVREVPPFQKPSTGVEATFVPVSGGMLNLNTGEIVDGTTAQNVAQAATVNPSILSSPAANLPAGIASEGVQQQVTSGTLPTAVSTGIIAGATNWLEASTNLLGYAIPNYALAGGGLLLALFLFGGGKRGRR